ncbi:MAG: hypothetical protein GF320_04215 [Armatimonadia bacterium]|nr:hypothetical protein [Armatimonadia bacterium]
MSAPKLKNCSRCRNAFMAVPGQRICPNCVRQEEEVFLEVKEFLRDNPGSSMKEVADATGAAADVVMGFLRSGRLDAKLAPKDAGLSCASCGTSISSGRLCAKCEEKTTSQLGGGGAPRKEPKEEPSRGPGYRKTSTDSTRKTAGSGTTEVRSGFVDYKRGRS